MKKRVLIIGGDSFVASHFINFIGNEFKFRVISRVQQGYEDEMVFENLFELPEKIFKDIDTIINFAAIVHKPKIKNADIYERVNYNLPIHLAKLALQNKVNHFIQISTIAVYGNSQIINQNTAYAPNDLYGKYKLLADQALDDLAKTNDIKVSILRPSMIYGGGGKAPGNMTKLIKLVKKKYPLPFKRVNNSRQFLHISNFCLTLSYIIINCYTGNIITADPQPISTKKLIENIGKALNIRVKQFNIPGLWWLISILNKKVYLRLTGDLIIENTIPYKKITNKKPFSIFNGIIEMINQ